MFTNRSLFMVAALGGLLAGACLASYRRRERERTAPAAKPESLQTWEGEGGAVPMRSGRTAGQVTPSSADVGSESARGGGFERGDFSGGSGPH